LRHEEIASKFKQALKKDSLFEEEFIEKSSDKEGYLFPDTYLFPKTATTEKIIEKMTSTFEEKVGYDITYEQLIIASIIERETKGQEEKPVVAGIIFKRLKNNWPLQVDASLQYVNGNWKQISPSDKEINSLYNTYKYQGLPPGPICNPGLSSIEAVINPLDSEYWYYLHEDNGVIHYASSLEDHNANIRKYLY